jgi:hypothetical protein
MTNIVLFDPSDSAVITFNWTDVVVSPITLVSAVHTVPAPMVKVSESTDVPNSLSQVKVSGAVHGGVCLIEGQATLSNGDVVNRQFPVRGFNA